METNIPYDLIAKYLSEESNKEETTKVNKWIAEDEKHRKEFKQMKDIIDHSKANDYQPDIELALKKIHEKLPEQLPAKNNWIGNVLKIAAIFIIGLGIGYFILSRNVTGNWITIINDQAESLPIEVSLPDGSLVWLREGSKISHPKEFSKKIRQVNFEGKAYFDIKPNHEKPFIINTANTETRVLGTEFILQANPHDSIVKVSVTEGKVSLKPKTRNEKEELIVSVGETGVYNSINQSLKHETLNNANVQSLKTGCLDFYKTPAPEVIEALSQHYNKKFAFVSERIKADSITFKYNNMEFQEVLKMLEVILDIKITNEDGVYVISSPE